MQIKITLIYHHKLMTKKWLKWLATPGVTKNVKELEHSYAAGG